MRLLEFSSDGGLQLSKDFMDDIPIYAILLTYMGCVDEDEVTFNDIYSSSGKRLVASTVPASSTSSSVFAPFLGLDD